MKIGIYARGLSEKSGGPKEYIENITKSIVEEISPNDEFFIIHNLKENFLKKTNSNIKEIKINSNSKIICDLILAPKIIKNLNLDVVLFPKDTIPFFIKTKKVLTIYDLAYYLKEYNAYKFLDTVYIKFMTKSSCKRADKIIAISDNTKRDVINILGVNKDKIRIVYLASDEIFKQIKSTGLSSTKNKYHLNKKFIFYSGSISPRKNLKRLIEAFEKIKDETDLDLVITGNKMWNNKEEMEMIKNNKRIKVLGLVPKEDLLSLYNSAELYVYPSLYEGFGLPILEAQACGCPVITSNVSSMPEVAGKGAILVDPYNTDEISKAIEKIITNKNLRDDLIKKGFENTKRFSWKKTAQETLKVYKEVMKE